MEHFQYSEAVPWFNLSGTADQIKTTIKFQDLMQNGYIEILEVLKRENGQWVTIR